MSDDSNSLGLVSCWLWTPEYLHADVLQIRGGRMADKIRAELPHRIRINYEAGSQRHRSAQHIVNYIAQILPVPIPMDLGGEALIHGEIADIEAVESRPSDNPVRITVSYVEGYQNGYRNSTHTECELRDLPDDIQALIRQLHRDTNNDLKQIFWNTYGKGEMDPQKWKATKMEVFISYRESGLDAAQKLFDELGAYQNSSILLPRIDKIDLQAGNWMGQLMDMIASCRVFIPVLTNDYLEGPISKPELDQALRQTYKDDSRRIVPVLMEGTTDDYENHFLGGLQMILAQDGLTKELVEKVIKPIFPIWTRSRPPQMALNDCYRPGKAMAVFQYEATKKSQRTIWSTARLWPRRKARPRRS